MSLKQSLTADIFCGLVILSAILLGVGIMSIIPIISIFLILIAVLIIYWRIKVFPKTGFMAIKYIAIGGTLGIFIGLTSSLAGIFIMVKIAGMMIRYDTGLAILVWSCFVSTVIGVLFGHIKYRKAIKCKK